MKRKKSKSRCTICNRLFWMELQSDGKYKTKSVKGQQGQYCFPGEGCFK